MSDNPPYKINLSPVKPNWVTETVDKSFEDDEAFKQAVSDFEEEGNPNWGEGVPEPWLKSDYEDEDDDSLFQNGDFENEIG